MRANKLLLLLPGDDGMLSLGVVVGGVVGPGGRIAILLQAWGFGGLMSVIITPAHSATHLLG